MSECGPKCPCGNYDLSVTIGPVSECTAAQEAFDRDFPQRPSAWPESLLDAALAAQPEHYIGGIDGALTASTLIRSGKPNSHATFLGQLDKTKPEL